MSRTRSEIVANWLQIAANIGILAGLVLVGLQMKQNTDLLQVQLLYEESDRQVAIERTIIGETAADVLAKSYGDPRDLNLTEQRILEGHLWSVIEGWRAAYRLSEQGLIGPEDWKGRVVDEVPFVLGNPYGRAFWSVWRENTVFMAPQLANLIDQELEKAPNFTSEYFTDMQRKAIEYYDSSNQ
ncbi:MAG: hypothetical protein AAF541_12230 [Pseudomonadota bacterium]